MKKPTMLMILDGYGLAADSPGNAITQARTPCLDALFARYAHTSLTASGQEVGLPSGQMGNSEVGHLNMGAGRTVWQELTRISREIDSGDFFKNPVLTGAMETLAGRGSTLHLLGLLSDGGVHSHMDHLYALLKQAEQAGLDQVQIHCILDGRDVGPYTALTYVEELESFLSQGSPARIATVAGRYYAMDRDNRWDRVEAAYRVYTEGEGSLYPRASDLVQAAYDRGESDEFVRPARVAAEGRAQAPLAAGDGIIFFNFRPDRAREITRAFVDPDFTAFRRGRPVEDLLFVCLTQYDVTLPGVKVAYPPQRLDGTLGRHLSALGKTQLRIAETEKYAHVTFFFNGGIEAPDPLEDRVLIPSPSVATYDLQPEMSAPAITDRMLDLLAPNPYDLIVLNYANCDMVGHTGDFQATVRAVEAVDACAGRLVEAVTALGGRVLITADHGNADRMLDEEGKPATAHSLAPVPLLLVDPVPRRLASGGSLRDVAPTLLELMELPLPPEMTGRSLLR